MEEGERGGKEAMMHANSRERKESRLDVLALRSFIVWVVAVSVSLNG